MRTGMASMIANYAYDRLNGKIILREVIKTRLKGSCLGYNRYNGECRTRTAVRLVDVLGLSSAIHGLFRVF